MTQRPQTAIKAPRVKAVTFLLALAGGTFVGFTAAEERTVQVAVAARAVPAFTVVGRDDLALRAVPRDAAADAARATTGIAGRVALTALAVDEPVSNADVVPVPACAGSTSTFGVVVVALQTPVPSTVTKGTVVHLRSSAAEADPTPRAVFLRAVDPPEAAAEVAAVSYAELLVGAGDWAAAGRPTPWAVVPAAPC